MRPCVRLMCVLVVLVGTCLAQNKPASGDSDAADAAIAKVLQAQVDAWNRGDLKGFMDGYWNSPDVVFVSDMKQTRGWQRVYKQYQRHYQTGKAEMGKLFFAYMKPAHLLAPDLAYIDGEYKLSMSDGAQPHGYFTLILRKFPDGWKIIHDRTCPAEKDKAPGRAPAK